MNCITATNFDRKSGGTLFTTFMLGMCSGRYWETSGGKPLVQKSAENLVYRRAGRVVETPSHRDRILRAASDAFLKFGFEQTSTAEITRRAKISKRDLYSHFRDKRALLSAVVVGLQTDMLAAMAPRWSSTEDVSVVLHQAATTILDFILSDRFGKLLRIVVAEFYQSPGIAEQFYALGPHKGTMQTAHYLKGQMKQGKLRKSDPWKAAEDFLDLVVGAQRITAVVLGQVDPSIRRRAHVNHAVEAFLRIYAIGLPDAGR
jgi:TetR/AcrR family transcriptional repressor of mexJK operon